MKRILVSIFALFACVLAVPAAAQDGADEPASGFAAAANLGLTQFFDSGPTGFGLDLYPGWHLNEMLTIEGHFGFHTGKDDPVRFTAIPFMVGVRAGFDTGPVRPFVGAHFGAVAFRSKVSADLGPFGAISGTASTTNAAIDLGGGVEAPVGPVGVGGAVWFTNVFGDLDSAQYIHIGAHVSY